MRRATGFRGTRFQSCQFIDYRMTGLESCPTAAPAMVSSRLIFLALETTCDETGAAVLEGPRPPAVGVPRVLSSVVASQVGLHQRFGGVVPEIASRAHVRQVLPMIDQALRKANVMLADLGMIAVATRPGLVGALVVGPHGRQDAGPGTRCSARRRGPPGRPSLRLPACVSRQAGLSVRRPGGLRGPYKPLCLPRPARLRVSGGNDRRCGGRGL